MHIRWAAETGLVDAIEPMVATYKEVRGLQVRILSLHSLHFQCFDAVTWALEECLASKNPDPAIPKVFYLLLRATWCNMWCP